MKDFSDPEIAGYSNRTIIRRNLIFVQPRDRSSGTLQDFGFWNGTGNVSLDVVDGITLATVSRDFVGRGAMLTVGDIALSDKLDVTAVAVTLSQLEADVESAIRTYDMRMAQIQIYRALFDTANPRALIAPARCRFAGYVNTAPIMTPPEGGQAAVTLNCTGCTNELTRVNTDLRSDESQQRRSPGDGFFRYVAATGKVQCFWGEKQST